MLPTTTEFQQRCFHLPPSPYTKNGTGASQGTPPCNNVVTQPTKRHWGLSKDPAVQRNKTRPKTVLGPPKAPSRGKTRTRNKTNGIEASQETPPCKIGTRNKTNGIGAPKGPRRERLGLATKLTALGPPERKRRKIVNIEQGSLHSKSCISALRSLHRNVTKS